MQAPTSVPFVIPRRRPELGRELRSGALSGIVAGLAMSVALMALFGTFMNKSPFYPLAVIGDSAFGKAGVGDVNLWSVVAGMFVHELGPSLVWGILFGVGVWVARPQRGGTLLLFGVLVGATAQLVDVGILLPALRSGIGDAFATSTVHPNDAWTRHVPWLVSWIAHLVFGAALSLGPWSYDPLARTFD